LKIKTKIASYHTADSKPIKQQVNGKVILPSLVFPASSIRLSQKGLSGENTAAYVTSSLYYKPMMIVNDDSRVVDKLETSLTDDARVIIYDYHMFIIQATERQ
jgi:hypothetical protein